MLSDSLDCAHPGAFISFPRGKETEAKKTRWRVLSSRYLALRATLHVEIEKGHRWKLGLRPQTASGTDPFSTPTLDCVEGECCYRVIGGN